MTEKKLLTIQKRKLRKEIKEIKKAKLSLPSGNSERIELGRKLKELKQQLKEIKEGQKQVQEIQNENKGIIEQIITLQPDIKDIVNLNSFTKEQLELHLKKLIERKAKGEILSIKKEK